MACENSLKATDCFSVLKKTRIVNNVIKGKFNINSLPKNFDDQKAFVTGMLGILTITETKLVKIFPVSQFHIDGYGKPYRLARNRNGAGIIYMAEKTYQVECWQNTTFQIISQIYL